MATLKELQLSNSRLRRLPDFIALGRLDRPIGIYLLLWPTLWALWVAAEGNPSFQLIFIFMAGVFLTRTGGCIINDYADRDFDGHVTRTASRPLATGRISGKEALAVAAVIGALAFTLVLFTNTFTILLSVGGLLLACTYPYMKRHTYLPQLVLGAAFAWAVPMAFAAVSETVPEHAWLIYLATVAWTMAYDTLYAMVDREDDLKAGIKSTAILFGDLDLTMVGVLNGTALLALVLLGSRLDFSLWYYAGLLAAVLLWTWQLWQSRQRDRDACFRAFLHNHWVGAVIFAGIFLHYSLS
ncbi:4-hydroxybenzoate octaprenyltransferase [Ketobacter sp.]|uniref:4-hydroxybenzoate octaprenyltransferase n=1 Tax=Ketobacter sp. TaxID=2083498 RepID=UPI000F227839|nr:4-hydroxybenzoate octaprenyltransferase [Ketobacter sp.]RLT95066.1 MAG: 4-hydroxybenzoate octaprenyltransferase [Ketobacter sp.]